MVQKLGFSVLIKTGWVAQLLSWQQYNRCHCVSWWTFLVPSLKNTAASIFPEIFFSVFYYFSHKHYVITFIICIIQKHQYLLNEKDIPKRKTPIFFTRKTFQMSSHYFLLHRNFKCLPSWLLLQMQITAAKENSLPESFVFWGNKADVRASLARSICDVTRNPFISV